MSTMFLTWQDFGREKSTQRLTTVDLTAANFDAQVTARGNLLSATTAMVMGTLNRQGYGDVTISSNTPPVSVEAQREKKWLVTYEDTVTGKLYQTEIPTADLGADHLQVNTDNADFNSSDWIAYIAAFEAVVRAPDDPSHTVNVIRAEFVGRNL